MQNTQPAYLQNIPKNWEVKKLKFVAKVQTGGTPAMQGSKTDYFENGIFNWFTAADFNEEGILDNARRPINEQAISDNQVEIFPENSIYLVSIGATLGKVGISLKKGSANQQINIIVFDENKVFPKFGYYLLKANNEYVINEADHTTLPILNQTKTKNLSFALPPLPVQQAIADYLDRQTAQIDTLIAQKTKLIELMKEEEKAFINEQLEIRDNKLEIKNEGTADKKLKIKDKKWKKIKLKYVAEINPSKKKQIEAETLVTFLPMEKVSEHGDYEMSIKKPFSDLQSGFTYFEKNDVIVAKITPCFENGKKALLDKLDTEIGFGSTEFHVLRAKKELLDKKYLFYLISSEYFKTQGEAFMSGAAGQKRVPTDFISNFSFFIPDLKIQAKIVSDIEAHLVKSRAVVEKLGQEVSLLKEYRQSLISEAVSGRLGIQK